MEANAPIRDVKFALENAWTKSLVEEIGALSKTAGIPQRTLNIIVGVRGSGKTTICKTIEYLAVQQGISTKYVSISDIGEEDFLVALARMLEVNDKVEKIGVKDLLEIRSNLKKDQLIIIDDFWDLVAQKIVTDKHLAVLFSFLEHQEKIIEREQLSSSERTPLIFFVIAIQKEPEIFKEFIDMMIARNEIVRSRLQKTFEKDLHELITEISEYSKRAQTIEDFLSWWRVNAVKRRGVFIDLDCLWYVVRKDSNALKITADAILKTDAISFSDEQYTLLDYYLRSYGFDIIWDRIRGENYEFLVEKLNGWAILREIENILSLNIMQIKSYVKNLEKIYNEISKEISPEEPIPKTIRAKDLIDPLEAYLRKKISSGIPTRGEKIETRRGNRKLDLAIKTPDLRLAVIAIERMIPPRVKDIIETFAPMETVNFLFVVRRIFTLDELFNVLGRYGISKDRLSFLLMDSLASSLDENTKRLTILLSYKDAYRVGLFEKWYVMVDNILKELRLPYMEKSPEEFLTKIFSD